MHKDVQTHLVTTMKKKSSSNLQPNMLRTRKAYTKQLTLLQEQKSLRDWLNQLYKVLITPEQQLSYAKSFDEQTGEPTKIGWKIQNPGRNPFIEVLYMSAKTKFTSPKMQTTLCALMKDRRTPLVYSVFSSNNPEWLVNEDTNSFFTVNGQLVISNVQVATGGDYFSTSYADGIRIELADKLAFPDISNV